MPRGSGPGWRGIRAVAAVALAGAALAGGCGSSHSASTSGQSAATRSTPTPATTSHPPTALPPPVGSAQRVAAGGTTLTVKVLRVIDPLPGSGASLLPGSRAVGVMIRIVNRGPGIYDSSATGDVSIVASSGTSTPVFAPSGVCQTPLRDFDNYISPGETRMGCVVFSLASSARLEAVRFSPHAKAAGRVSWSVS